jgi:phenylalanyl-tRNA synthetase beta chain
MQEVITYALTTMQALGKVLPKEDLALYPPYRVANPVSAEHEYLRPTLRASLLQTLGSNLRFQEGPVALFETARVYLRPDEAASAKDRREGEHALPVEREHVCGAISGHRYDRWGRPSGEPLDFFDAKAYVEDLLHGLGVRADYAAASEHAMAPGRTAEVRVGGALIGVIGQVHPDVAAEFGIEQDAYLFDLELDALLPYATDRRTMRDVSRFPAVEQDLALVVDAGTPAGDVRRIIEAAPLVRSADVFDVYTGDQVPAGKKSLAFSVEWQADDHTLTDEEVARAQRRLVERLRRELGAELRGG